MLKIMDNENEKLFKPRFLIFYNPKEEAEEIIKKAEDFVHKTRTEKRDG